MNLERRGVVKEKGKRWKARMRRIILALICAGILFFAGAMLAIFVAEKTERLPQSADVIIVLGARVMPDGELSTTLMRRIETALEIYRGGFAKNFIVCGAQGPDEPMAEADAMAEYLIENGVPASAVFREDQSFNTKQNLTNAQAFMNEQGFTNALLVSSDYHVARSLKFCSDLGIQASGINAPGPDYWHNRMKARFREVLSWTHYILLGW